MKAFIAQILIGTSILATATLGYRIVRLIFLLSQAAPGERVFFGWSPRSFLRWLCIALSPLAVYGLAFALYHDSISSQLGRIALVANILYVIIFLIGCAYVHRFISSLNRNT